MMWKLILIFHFCHGTEGAGWRAIAFRDIFRFRNLCVCRLSNYQTRRKSRLVRSRGLCMKMPPHSFERHTLELDDVLYARVPFDCRYVCWACHCQCHTQRTHAALIYLLLCFNSLPSLPSLSFFFLASRRTLLIYMNDILPHHSISLKK